MWAPFEIRVPGKWVLAGEHSVLRGGTAVALPHPEFGLTLTFQPQVWEGLSVVPRDAEAVIADILDSIQGLRAPVGTLQIQSTIPIGAGLGSSAALCVAMTRWLAGPLGLDEEEILPFATRLEHRFHGKSSGMDIAVISAEAPVRFTMAAGPQSLGVKRLPKFTFHDTGVRARTSDCIQKVEALRETQPQFARGADEAMSEASRLAIEGLTRFGEGSENEGLAVLARSIRKAQECFEAWDLVPSEARALERDLVSRGALAAKMTGAGGGGMMVALWNS